ncbi:hypothetical protein C8Q74DRAFT_1309689 [Fomes fomentarius]|nr:hypothetical protein C8Q74DRAFT_1309689 [Fomes fomentarius]
MMILLRLYSLWASIPHPGSTDDTSSSSHGHNHRYLRVLSQRLIRASGSVPIPFMHRTLDILTLHDCMFEDYHAYRSLFAFLAT